MLSVVSLEAYDVQVQESIVHNLWKIFVAPARPETLVHARFLTRDGEYLNPCVVSVIRHFWHKLRFFSHVL